MNHDMTMGEMFQLAKMLVHTQGILPPSIRTEGEAVAVMLAGRELGLPAMASLRLIALLKGKVTIDASGQLALMQRAGAKVQWLKDGTDGEAILRIARPGNEPFESRFTLEMAKNAGLLSNGTWQKYPAAMMRARCVSAAGKAYYADVLGGVYMPGELDDDDRHEPPLMIDGSPQPTLPATPSKALPASTQEAPQQPRQPPFVPDESLTTRGETSSTTSSACASSTMATDGRTITDVLADIAACEHVDKLAPLLHEARRAYKSLSPALQLEVVAVCKAAPEQVQERDALRRERDEAERALGAAGGPPDDGDDRSGQTGDAPEPGAQDAA